MPVSGSGLLAASGHLASVQIDDWTCGSCTSLANPRCQLPKKSTDPDWSKCVGNAVSKLLPQQLLICLRSVELRLGRIGTANKQFHSECACNNMHWDKDCKIFHVMRCIHWDVVWNILEASFFGTICLVCPVWTAKTQLLFDQKAVSADSEMLRMKPSVDFSFLLRWHQFSSTSQSQSQDLRKQLAVS